MNEMYTYTIPVFIKSLGGLRKILEKTEAYSKEKGIDAAVILTDKLAEDMYSFKKQVQIACDQAKGGAARLSGIEVPKHEDTEQTIGELIARIDKTLAFLSTMTEDSFEGAAERQITLPYFPEKYMTGFDYAREYVIPNFFFHYTLAYALLRKNGVPLGKADFVNGLPLKPLS